MLTSLFEIHRSSLLFERPLIIHLVPVGPGVIRPQLEQLVREPERPPHVPLRVEREGEVLDDVGLVHRLLVRRLLFPLSQCLLHPDRGAVVIA